MSAFREALEAEWQKHIRANCGRCPHRDDYTAGARAVLLLAAKELDDCAEDAREEARQANVEHLKNDERKAMATFSAFAGATHRIRSLLRELEEK